MQFRKFLFLFALPLFALEEEELTWDETPTYSVQDYNRFLQESLAAQEWWSVVDYAELISYNFPESPFASEAAFLIGKAYFNLGQLELANDQFSVYLNNLGGAKHFEEAIQLKFQIAEAFRTGVKKRLFGSHKMPAWLSAEEDAVKIYEEVITTLPHHDIAAKAMLGKAKILALIEDFKPSVETLQQLIRRFPKHELAAEAYLEIGRVYLEQCRVESLDSDLLDLAEVNLRRFKQAFPRESKIEEAEKLYFSMQELFARNILEIGEFFQKTHKPSAAQIYFSKVTGKFPKSEAAALVREKYSIPSSDSPE